jgi:hypothetical protein
MHFFAFAMVMHTLIIAVVAFFILFAASKADGFVRLLGNILGWVILILGVLGFAFGIVHVATGKEPDMGHDHWMMMHWGDRDRDGPPAPIAAPAQPAPPAAPAPETPKGK